MFSLDMQLQSSHPGTKTILYGVSAGLFAASLALYGYGQQLNAHKISHQLAVRDEPAAPTKPVLSEEERQRLRKLADLIAHLNLDPQPLLERLASTLGSDVALLSFTLGGEGRELSLTVTAKDQAALFDFIKRLEASPRLGAVTLLEHRHDDQADYRTEVGRVRVSLPPPKARQLT